MNYQIEQWPAFKIAGLKKVIKTAEAFQVIPQIWETAWQDGTMNRLLELIQKADYRPAGLLGVSASGKWGDSEDMNYYLAVTNHVDAEDCEYVPVPEGMVELSLPSATWAIFEANGELPDAVQNIYKEFYTEWLPNSGYQLADLPVIESYMMGDQQEVWIAIVKQ